MPRGKSTTGNIATARSGTQLKSLSLNNLIGYLQTNPNFQIGQYTLFWNKGTHRVSLFKMTATGEPQAIAASGDCINWMNALDLIFNVMIGGRTSTPRSVARSTAVTTTTAQSSGGRVTRTRRAASHANTNSTGRTRRVPVSRVAVASAAPAST